MVTVVSLKKLPEFAAGTLPTAPANARNCFNSLIFFDRYGPKQGPRANVAPICFPAHFCGPMAY